MQRVYSSHPRLHTALTLTLTPIPTLTPTRHPLPGRPALVFFWLHKELHSLFEAHSCAMTPVRCMLEHDLERLSSTFEKIELLNLTVLPVACPPSRLEPASPDRRASNRALPPCCCRPVPP